MKRDIITILLAFFAVVGQAREKIVWEHPTTAENNLICATQCPEVGISRVEFAKEETRVMMHVVSNPYYSIKFSSKSCLVLDGKKYALKGCAGTELDKEIHIQDAKGLDVIFHFEPLPLKTNHFDFIGGDYDGAFHIMGIEDVRTRAARLFSSNWRNNETGEWGIGFYDDMAVYDCKFWNYKHKEQHDDRYLFVLENEGREIAVSVDKNRNGQREIAIDGKKGTYGFISSVTMPDYPKKDADTKFKDTHYVPDTVTIVGWSKDMPESMKKEGGKFNIFYQYNFGGKFASMDFDEDSLGRCVIKLPLLNATHFSIYDGQTYFNGVWEPGETYFVLFDYKEGHKLVMGKHSHFINECLSYPMEFPKEYLYEEVDEVGFAKFVEDTKQNKANRMAKLERFVKAHPNLSNQYIYFQKGLYNMGEGAMLAGAAQRLRVGDYPADYLSYVTQQDWQQLLLPLSLNPYNWFVDDYLDLKHEDTFSDKISKNRHSFSMELARVPILKLYRDIGKVSVADDQLAEIQNYSEHHQHEKPEVMKRKDIDSILSETMPTWFFYEKLTVIDSLDCDKDLRDIIITKEFMQLLEQKNIPLDDTHLEIFRKKVSMPAARDTLMAEQQKYIEIQQKDFAHVTSIKSSDDVANMSDGEKILRKLIEPYKGKLVLMDIWGTWCGPCKEALSHSKEEYERLKDYDVVYLYLANNSPQEQWENVIKKYEVLGDNVAHYNLPKEQQKAIEQFFGVEAFPFYRLIDREGNILDVDADPRNLERLINIIERVK